MNTKKLNISHSDLEQFTGTTCYFRYSPQLFPNFLLTDGCRFLAEQAECFWLFDIIASVQSKPRVAELAIQFWTLLVAKDKTAFVKCIEDTTEDGHDLLVYAQQIDYTDFPLEFCRIWVMECSMTNPITGQPCMVAILPSEY